MPTTPPTVGTGDAAPGTEWWRTADIRAELRDTWRVHGPEALQGAREIGAPLAEAASTAYEIGTQIAQAISAHLPDPYAAAQRRNLDLRWLRLKVTIPALALSCLPPWGGQSAEGRMTHYMETQGLLAPLGWVLLPALLVGVLLVLPFGGLLGAALGGLVSAVLRSLLTLVRRAWSVPYLGYLLRLAVATAAWGFLIAVGRLAGRILIHWLAGV